MKTTFDAEALSFQILEQNPILRSKISSALECDEKCVPIALAEVLRFLFLVYHKRSVMLTPSTRVDLAWHEFILCTRAYEAFCNKHFGKFIHHYPGGSESDNRRQFAETLRFYKDQFGMPDKLYWGSSGFLDESCGSCEST